MSSIASAVVVSSIASASLTESTFAPASTATAEAQPSGFAARRNTSCLPAENDCFFTELPFVACCPLGLVCARQFNAVCCPDPGNCTQPLITHPGCANVTWNLYDNGGYFCCDPDAFGYSFGTGSGCAGPGDSVPDFSIKLPILQRGIPGDSFKTSSSAPISSATQTSPAATSSQPAGATTNTGAIAGGVVGGVVGLLLIIAALWFLIRRRRNTQALTQPRDGYGLAYGDTKAGAEKRVPGPISPPRPPRPPPADAYELPAPPPGAADRSWLALEPHGPSEPGPRELPS